MLKIELKNIFFSWLNLQNRNQTEMVITLYNLNCTLKISQFLFSLCFELPFKSSIFYRFILVLTVRSVVRAGLKVMNSASATRKLRWLQLMRLNRGCNFSSKETFKLEGLLCVSKFIMMKHVN